MDTASFFALTPGPTQQPDGSPATLAVYELGELALPTGRLGVCDPFIFLDDPLVVAAPAGSFPVRLTVADVSLGQDGGRLRAAYLSVVFSGAPSVRVAGAPALSDAEAQLSEAEAAVLAQDPGAWADRLPGVGVDTGTVGFVDAGAVAEAMPGPADDWFETVMSPEEGPGWLDRVDAAGPQPAGAANIALPLGELGENVVLCRTGRESGQFPVLASWDADGALTGVHIDLLVVGELAEALAEAAAPQPVTGMRGWLGRLLGR